MNILFVADKFADSFRSENDRYVGGAERTDHAAIEAAPGLVTTSDWENVPTLSDFDLIIVGNSADAPIRELRRIAATGRHVLFEHDLRICHWRGNFPTSWDPVHRWSHRCVCPHHEYRRLFDTAAGTIFLTERQKKYYVENPFWESGRTSEVLGSSLFGDEFLDFAESISTEKKRAGAAILSTKTKIKGTKQAAAMCKEKGWTINRIEGMTPEEVWQTLAASERFVYLPIGLEPAGRMPVEARLLGCDVIVNDHVGVAGEPLWELGEVEFAETLRQQPKRFWDLALSFL